jgi:hypothetical protein
MKLDENVPVVRDLVGSGDRILVPQPRPVRVCSHPAAVVRQSFQKTTESFLQFAIVRWRTLAARNFDGIYDGILGKYRHPISVKIPSCF